MSNSKGVALPWTYIASEQRTICREVTRQRKRDFRLSGAAVCGKVNV
jgi:hypothetical protein